MTEDEVVNAIIGALAPIVGVDVTTLWEQLGKDEGDLPYDSLVLAEVLVALEEELGIEVPMDTRTARALRSVRQLARRIVEVMTGAGAQ